MIKLIIYMTFQSLFLVLSQIFLKKAMQSIEIINFNLSIVFEIIKNIWIYLTFISLGLSGVIWVFVLKRYDFSIAYPMVSISYIFALIMSKYYLHEKINLTMVAGVAIIILGIIVLSIGKKSIV